MQVNFTGARVNIVANSDNHGKLNNLPDFYNAIKQNGDDIFQKAEEESTLNLYINAGDFFINPAKKGWKTKGTSNSGQVQAQFFQKLVQKIGKVANTAAYNQGNGAKTNYDAIYTPGNHDFDGGDAFLYDILRDVKGITTVMTNVNLNQSHLLKREMINKNSNFATKKVYEIPDDKDSNKKHHLMVLGATIPAMDFYNPGLLRGTIFSDSNSERDVKLSKADIQGTIDSIKKEVEVFKKQHPKGIVVLSSHMGTKLSKIIANEVPGITEILDGHKHDIVTTSSRNGTTISSLGMDNEIVKSISLVIDDDGDIEERETRTYSSEQYRLERSSRKTNAIYRMLYEKFESDTNPILRIDKDKYGEVPFDYKPSIRYGNSYLANFLTAAIKASIKQIKEENDIVAVGIQSSIIRGGLEDGSSSMDILKVFDGVSEDLSDVKIGKISGENLLGMVFENIKDNISAPNRNTIIQWSDIKIDRGEIKKLLSEKPNASYKDAAKFIEIRMAGNKPYGQINPKAEYKIAIADKYLKKTDIKTPELIKDDFYSIGQTYNDLFLKYLDDENYNIKILPKFEEERIIDID